MKHDFLLDVRNERNILYKQTKQKKKKEEEKEEEEFNIQSKDIFLYIMSIPIRKNNALTTTNRNNTFETIRRITKEKR